jgi:hypothetical protein
MAKSCPLTTQTVAASETASPGSCYTGKTTTPNDDRGQDPSATKLYPPLRSSAEVSVYPDDFLEPWVATPPFSRFTGYLKCIRLDQSDYPSSAVMEDMFGEFFADEPENIEG